MSMFSESHSFFSFMENITEVIHDLVTYDIITQHVCLSPYRIQNSKTDALFLF